MTVETNIGKITASKEVLNWICGAFEREAKYYKERENYDALAKHADSISWEIYNALKKKGYYD